MVAITRRAVLAGTAALTLSARDRARAATPAAGLQAPGIYRYRLGSYELTALNDGVWYFPVDDKFVHNAVYADVKQAMADAFMPTATGTYALPYTALLVNTGAKLVLIDTGTGGQIAETAGSLAANLAAAGVDPKAIDQIVISHLHPDHINGIKTKDDAVVFPNAEIAVPAPEWTFWMDESRLSGATDKLRIYLRNVRRIFGNIGDRVRRFEPGQEVAPGITSIAAFGHTPGHTAFAVASGNQSMLVLSDTANQPALFVRHPEWQIAFDMDGDMAVATRKRLLDRAAADRMLVQGYHFPFPASGHVLRTAQGYELVPVQWQPQL